MADRPLHLTPYLTMPEIEQAMIKILIPVFFVVVVGVGNPHPRIFSPLIFRKHEKREERRRQRNPEVPALDQN